MTILEAFPAFDHYLRGEDLSIKTRKEYKGALLGASGLYTAIGELPLELITIHHINAWKIELRDKGLSAEYRNNGVKAVRRFFRWAGETDSGLGLKVVAHDKVHYDKADKNRPHTTLTAEETAELIAGTSNLRDRALIMIYFGTGCRASEILQLDRWDWEGAQLVDATEGVWQIEVLGKNKKYRPVCFFNDVKEAVDDYLDERTDRYKPLFISMQNRRLHYATMNQMIHKAARKAGLDKVVTPHVARHTFITDRAAVGMPLPILAFMVGHANSAVTQRIYTHINQTHSQKAFGKYKPDKVI